MKNRFVILLILLNLGLCFSKPVIKEPCVNPCTVENQKYLKSRNYNEIKYNEFDAVSLFKKTYKLIYDEEYDDYIPNYIFNYKADDGIYYSMLYDSNKEDDPPVLTYSILEGPSGKICYYKQNLKKETIKLESKVKNLEGEEKELKINIFY